MKLYIAIIVILLASLSVVYSQNATETIVNVIGFAFSPSAVTIARNGCVRWNGLNGTVGHNVAQVTNATSVTRVTNGFYSGPQGSVGTYARCFPDAGVYYYICEPHAPGMRGNITVTGTTPTPSPGRSPRRSPTPTTTTHPIPVTTQTPTQGAASLFTAAVLVLILLLV